MNKPVIITDVDGVVLKWQSMLPFFAQKYGIDLKDILEIQLTEEFKHTSELFHCAAGVSHKLKREYHESDFMRYLSAYDDALRFINRNKDKYEFIAVTALEASERTLLNRTYNLNTLFPGAFSQIILTDNDKSDAFMRLLIELKQKNKKVLAYCDDLVHHLKSFEYEYKNSEYSSLFLDKKDIPPYICHFIRSDKRITDNRFNSVKSWDEFDLVLQGKNI